MQLDWKAYRRAGGLGNWAMSLITPPSIPWRGLSAVVLGAMLAKWAWLLFAPQEVVFVATAEQGAPAEGDNLFGVAAASGASATAGVLPNVRLTGVFAGTPGFAIFELEGNKQVGVVVGGEVVRGVKLSEVGADYAVIEGGGGRQRINMQKKDHSTEIVSTSDTALPAEGRKEKRNESLDGRQAAAPSQADVAAMLEKQPVWRRNAVARQMMQGRPH